VQDREAFASYTRNKTRKELMLYLKKDNFQRRNLLKLKTGGEFQV